ncbi:MAG: hypothetical protein ACYTEQ_19880, partial [Planctomycetota bacterium]
MSELPIQETTGSDDVLVNDPLHQYLGPQSGNKVLGNYQEEDIPDQIIAVLDEFGLHGGKAFRVIIKELPDGVDDPALGAFVKSFSRSVPTVDYLGRNYGPGRYCLVFQWRAKDSEQDKLVNKSERVLIEVSDKFEPEYREYQHKLKLERLKKRKESVQDAVLESKLEGSLLDDQVSDSRNPNQTAKEYVKEMLSFNEQLGLKRSGIDWDRLLPVLLSALPVALKAMSELGANSRAQQNQLMTLMLTQSNNYNSQLVEVMKNMGPQNGSDSMKEFREMLVAAIDMKELIHGDKKDTLADKIFSLIETVGPQLLQVASMSAAARASDPRIKLARNYLKNSPDFQALMNSPESQSNLVRKLDSFYGWRQTDSILSVIGRERP